MPYPKKLQIIVGTIISLGLVILSLLCGVLTYSIALHPTHMLARGVWFFGTFATVFAGLVAWVVVGLVRIK
jgi:hypothetical protein